MIEDFTEGSSEERDIPEGSLEIEYFPEGSSEDKDIPEGSLEDRGFSRRLLRR